MPTFVVEENWNDHKAIVDHWRALKIKDISSQFSLEEKYPLIRNYLTQRKPGKRQPICNSKRCDPNGIQHATHCEKQKQGCALLMSSFPGNLISSLSFSAEHLVWDRKSPIITGLFQTQTPIDFTDISGGIL